MGQITGVLGLEVLHEEEHYRSNGVSKISRMIQYLRSLWDVTVIHPTKIIAAAATIYWVLAVARN